MAGLLLKVFWLQTWKCTIKAHKLATAYLILYSNITESQKVKLYNVLELSRTPLKFRNCLNANIYRECCETTDFDTSNSKS